MKEQLEEIIKWTSVSNERVHTLYSVYKTISGDSRRHCKKCPSIIRTIFEKVKLHYKENYEK